MFCSQSASPGANFLQRNCWGCKSSVTLLAVWTQLSCATQEAVWLTRYVYWGIAAQTTPLIVRSPLWAFTGCYMVCTDVTLSSSLACSTTTMLMHSTTCFQYWLLIRYRACACTILSWEQEPSVTKEAPLDTFETAPQWWIWCPSGHAQHVFWPIHWPLEVSLSLPIRLEWHLYASVCP